jgi:hypothetical protein
MDALKYLRHLDWCPKTPCVCGYWEALEEIVEALHPSGDEPTLVAYDMTMLRSLVQCKGKLKYIDDRDLDNLKEAFQKACRNPRYRVDLQKDWNSWESFSSETEPVLIEEGVWSVDGRTVRGEKIKWTKIYR